MAKNDEIELWERQPEESAKAWEAFVIYRDLGLQRSLRKVAEELSKSETLMKRWSKQYDWPKRAQAWDAEQDRISRAAQVEEIKKMRRRHAKIAETAMDKISAALERLDPEDISNSDIARLMSEASKLERLSRGDVGEVIEERDGGAAPSPVTFYMPDNHRDKKE